jgi:hypothetical protein
MTDPGTVDGDLCSAANAINSKRQIVGISFPTRIQSVNRVFALTLTLA